MAWLPLSSESPDLNGDSMPALRGASVQHVEQQKIPKAGELDTWKWEQHRLESDVAASLGFGIGSAKGAGRSRTLVAEFSRSKTVSLGATQARYGVAARLVVNVLGIEGDINLTLPFVAAHAEFNNLEAYANLTVEGYRTKSWSAIPRVHGVRRRELRQSHELPHRDEGHDRKG
jgi:hypothetical protein